MPETKTKSIIPPLIGRSLLAGAIAAAAIAPASAVADVFLELQGIPGASVDAKHKGEIDVLTYTQSFSNTGSSSNGGAGTGKASCGPVTVTKNIDKASPLLIKAVTTGRIIPTGTLTFRQVGGADLEYYTVDLKNILITSIDQTDQNDAARILEEITFTASELKFKFTPQAANGKQQPAITYDLNCAQQKSE
jgi:type VI secretion system secreted protein Hcp